MNHLDKLIKAIQIEREIVGHLIVDDPHPEIWEELLNAHAYTDSLLKEKMDESSRDI